MEVTGPTVFSEATGTPTTVGLSGETQSTLTRRVAPRTESHPGSGLPLP